MLKHRFFLLAMCCYLPCYALQAAPERQELQELPNRVAISLKKMGLPSSSLSALVIPAKQGNALVSHNAQRSVSAASTMKLLTTFIALDQLGPNFRWKTQVFSDSPIVKGVLTGNLVLRGGGDPNLTWDKLGIILRTLRQQGLREIHGDIILDRSYFQPNRPELGQTAFDENPDAYYNVIPDALLVHSNITAFSMDANSDSVAFTLMTPMENPVVHNLLTLNNSPSSEWKNTWQKPVINIKEKSTVEITLQGSFPRRCQTTVFLNILERNPYISSMLRALWSELGGSWSGQIIDGKTPENALLLHERDSESLADTLRIINKYSDNAMSRILFMTMGMESPQAKVFTDSNLAANAVVRTWLAKHDIDDTGLVVENGSGLSRIDRISASQLASILQVAANSNWSPEFLSSLPIVAVDGSMRKRLKGSNAEGRARIKTGYLKNVMAIAGYVRDIHQQDWIVVGIINSDLPVASKGKPALDELIEWVASGRPNP